MHDAKMVGMDPLLLDLLIGIAGLVIGYLTKMLRPERKAAASNPLRWCVWVGPATMRDPYDYYDRGKPIEGEIAVRLKRGKESQSYGTVPINDPQFEPKLNALVREAEERCGSLNAAYDEVGR